MKSLLITGTVITEKNAADYLRRMVKRLFIDNMDMAGSIALDMIEDKLVSAGFFTWEQIEDIEIQAMAA